MKLYTMRGSRYGSRCLIQLAAKGLAAEVELLSYPPPESYRAVNPLMLVPALEVDGAILPESQVICEYLEDRYPEPSLRPADPAERARMRLLIRLFELHYDPAVLTLFAFLDPSKPRDPKVLEGVAQQAKKVLSLMAERLDGGMYAVGGRLSLADCALMTPFLQARILFPALGLDDPIDANPKILAYYDATRRDPHVAGVLDDLEPYLRQMMGG